MRSPYWTTKLSDADRSVLGQCLLHHTLSVAVMDKVVQHAMSVRDMLADRFPWTHWTVLHSAVKAHGSVQVACIHINIYMYIHTYTSVTQAWN